MKKKFLILSLALFSAMAISACGEDGDKNEDKTEAAVAEESKAEPDIAINSDQLEEISIEKSEDDKEMSSEADPMNSKIAKAYLEAITNYGSGYDKFALLNIDTTGYPQLVMSDSPECIINIFSTDNNGNLVCLTEDKIGVQGWSYGTHSRSYSYYENSGVIIEDYSEGAGDAYNTIEYKIEDNELKQTYWSHVELDWGGEWRNNQ